MKKGINQWAFPGNFSIPEIIHFAAKHRFDGVELCPDEEGIFPLTIQEQKLLEWKALSEEKNIEIRSIASGLHWKYNLASPNKNIQKKAIDTAKRLIEIASILGAKSILLIPGYVNVPWDPSSEIVPYEKAYENARLSISEIAKFAADAKVTLGLENVWNKLFLSPLEFRSFIDNFNNQWIRVHFDTANVLISGYPEQWIEILGKRIVTIHLKDFKLSVGNINGFCLPLEGDVNFPAVMESLKLIGYDDFLIAEMIPPYHYSIDALLANLSYNLDCIMNMRV